MSVTEPSTPQSIPDVVVCEQDLSDDLYGYLLSRPILAVDVETTGLSAAADKLALIQLYDGCERAVFVKSPDVGSKRLRALLERSDALFVFHFARFDLGFISSALGADSLPRQIACTKVAARLVSGMAVNASLSELLRAELGVELKKPHGIRTSNWASSSLSYQQLVYALNDVRWLIPLWRRFESKLNEAQATGVAAECFAAIRTIAKTDAHGLEGLFEY